jgi:hypothetical protein
MPAAERLESALRSPDPNRALRALILELAAEGCRKADIYALLEQTLLDLRSREDHREADEDAVLDALDSLTEWCHPDARLLPEQNLTGPAHG